MAEFMEESGTGSRTMRPITHWMNQSAAAVVTAGFLAGLPAASAADVGEFYRGKTITVVIGYSVGGGDDIFARLLAPTLGRHMPGNPLVVPQNMPGAGSRKAGMYLYNVAPKDGTFIGTIG